VAAGEEAIAEAATPLAAAQVVKKARFYAKNQRDCGAASAVGAATVAISLLIGDGKVTPDAFYVLLAVQTLLIYAAAIFAMRAAGLTAGLTVPDWNPAVLTGTIGAASSVITAAGEFLTSQLKHESNAGSLSWWLLLALAGAGALLGLSIRRSAETLLDQLDDESWEQRIAPLISEQKRALEEMGALRNAPAEAAGAGARVTPASPGTFPSAP
jgi:hypothetical protein